MIVEAVLFGVMFATGLGMAAEPGAPMGPLSMILPAIIGLLYWAVLESSKWQGTLGKLAVGLRVTNLEGQRISFPRALGRTLAKIISGLILLIGYIMVAFTERKQGLHDMLAGTLVVKKGAVPAAVDPAEPAA